MPMPRTRSGAPKEARANEDGALVIEESSLTATAGGTSQAIDAVSANSVPSAVINEAFAVVSPTIDCFMRQGAAPVATNDGTDQFLFGGLAYRVTLTKGNKLAFRGASSSGKVYITPGA